MSIYTDGTADNFATSTETPPVTGDPVTIAVWFQRLADTASIMVSLGQSASLLNAITLGVSTAGEVQARKYDGTSNTTATSTTGADDTATWHHACGVYVSDTVRHAYLDGGSKGTQLQPSSRSSSSSSPSSSSSSSVSSNLTGVAIRYHPH